MCIVKDIFLYLFSVKSLVLVPLDIYTDVKLAITHFGNGHVMWGTLTSVCLLPSLMFPYHYFHLLKFAWYKFLLVFFDRHKYEVKFLEEKNRQGDGIIAYFEDIPQFILQVYILWKTPESCFSWREINAVQSIVTSFISISATVVPFYEKEKDKDWSLFSCRAFVQDFLMGTFLNVIPKLLLISWTFSVLNWYGWFFIVPLLLVCAIMSYWHYRDQEYEDEGKNVCSYILFRSFQLAFGYSGIDAHLIVCILLLLFLIPLGINLAGAVNSLEVTNSSDPFDAFPVDPFPSSTICFTNSSIIDQEERWENKTTPFSNSCNKTFEAIPCYEVKDQIMSKLLGMIAGTVSLLFFYTAIGLEYFIQEQSKDRREQLEMGRAGN